MVLQHACYRQLLGDDGLVLANQPGGELVEVVLAAITDPKMLPGQLIYCFPAVFAAFLLAVYRLLQTRQPMLCLLQTGD